MKDGEDLPQIIDFLKRKLLKDVDEAGQGRRKSSWPELVGRPRQEAEAVLASEAEDCSVLFLPQDSMVTADFSEDRIRVFVDDEGVVSRVPGRG